MRHQVCAVLCGFALRKGNMGKVSFRCSSVFCESVVVCSLSATPAVDSHPSPFGRHLTYRENMSSIAVVVHGSLLIYVLDGARGALQQIVPVIRSKVPVLSRRSIFEHIS